MNDAMVATPKQEIQINNGMMQLTSLQDAYRFAQYVIKSGLAPKSFDSAEKVMIAWQHGAELGLRPMQALQHVGIVNGRPSIYGKGAAAIVMQSGLCELFEEHFEGEGEELTAICKVRRRGLATVREQAYTVADAKRAGLWGKPGVWTQYPKDMMMYKARARAFVLFADVLAGLPILEDIQDVPPEPRAIRTDAPLPDPLLQDVTPEPPPEEVKPSLARELGFITDEEVP